LPEISVSRKIREGRSEEIREGKIAGTSGRIPEYASTLPG
jgi:hypothetical protein